MQLQGEITSLKQQLHEKQQAESQATYFSMMYDLARQDAELWQLQAQSLMAQQQKTAPQQQQPNQL